MPELSPPNESPATCRRRSCLPSTTDLQTSQPQFEDGAIYRPRLPTQRGSTFSCRCGGRIHILPSRSSKTVLSTVKKGPPKRTRTPTSEDASAVGQRTANPAESQGHSHPLGRAWPRDSERRAASSAFGSTHSVLNSCSPPRTLTVPTMNTIVFRRY